MINLSQVSSVGCTAPIQDKSIVFVAKKYRIHSKCLEYLDEVSFPITSSRQFLGRSILGKSRTVEIKESTSDQKV